MNDKSLKIKGSIIQIQQNTSNSSQTITNVDSIVNKDAIDKILEFESEFNNLYGEMNSKTFKELLLYLRKNDFKETSIKQTILEKLQAIAIGASGNVIGEGILHFINLI
jgi:hypothetical protein